MRARSRACVCTSGSARGAAQAPRKKHGAPHGGPVSGLLSRSSRTRRLPLPFNADRRAARHSRERGARRAGRSQFCVTHDAHNLARMSGSVRPRAGRGIPPRPSVISEYMSSEHPAVRDMARTHCWAGRPARHNHVCGRRMGAQCGATGQFVLVGGGKGGGGAAEIRLRRSPTTVARGELPLHVSTLQHSCNDIDDAVRGRRATAQFGTSSRSPFTIGAFTAARFALETLFVFSL